MSKRLTVEDWDDVADLCEQAENMVGLGVVGEEPTHTRAAKDRAVMWIHKLTMKAHDKARRLESNNAWKSY